MQLAQLSTMALLPSHNDVLNYWHAGQNECFTSRLVPLSCKFQSQPTEFIFMLPLKIPLFNGHIVSRQSNSDLSTRLELVARHTGIS